MGAEGGEEVAEAGFGLETTSAQEAVEVRAIERVTGPVCGAVAVEGERTVPVGVRAVLYHKDWIIRA